MGPVSFEPVVTGLGRSALLNAANLLADAGIRAQVIDGPTKDERVGQGDDALGQTPPTDGGGSLLVRSADLIAARGVLDAAGASASESDSEDAAQ